MLTEALIEAGLEVNTAHVDAQSPERLATS
jgi:hypothetical protein